jgi:hypothetical protein
LQSVQKDTKTTSEGASMGEHLETQSAGRLLELQQKQSTVPNKLEPRQNHSTGIALEPRLNQSNGVCVGASLGRPVKPDGGPAAIVETAAGARVDAASS